MLIGNFLTTQACTKRFTTCDKNHGKKINLQEMSKPIKCQILCIIATVFVCLCSSGWQRLCAQDISSVRFFKLNFNTLSSPNSIISDLPQGAMPVDDEPSQLFGLDLRFPIKLQGATKLIGAIGYDRELLAGFAFIDEGENEIEPLSLHNPSLSLAVLHSFNEQWSLKNNLTFQSRSDQFFSFSAQSIAFRNSLLIEKKKNKDAFGFGISAGYSNNRLSILPILVYQKELPNNWQLDFLLPSRALMIKNLNRDTRLLFGVKGNTAQYFFNNQTIDGYAALSYRRLNVNAIVGYEKQLTPLIGVGIEAGATVPLRSGLYQNSSTWQEVHNFGDKIAPYFNVKFFLSLPK